MNAHMTDLGVKPNRGCGCGGQCGCEGRCCDLECLVRPNFFCGQLLTDADLGAMVDWTRKRLALARYRDGWGVVCGLDVTCSAPGGGAQCCDAQNGPAVYVNPGYAIDCCGNDLVVCEPLRVDLSAICRIPDDPCDPKMKVPAEPAKSGPDTPTDCFEMLKRDLVAVQLSLRYHEDLAQGQRAMFRSGCSDVGPCEYARVLERPYVHLEVIPMSGGELDEEAEERRWLASLAARLKEQVSQIEKLLKEGPEALVQHLKRNPPYQFCFLEELVCCLRGRDIDRAQFLRVAIYLLLDWMLRELRCACKSCRSDAGVPLGRVLLRRSVIRGRTECKVVVIDAQPPHRRPLRKDRCRPVREGIIDLGEFIWQRPALVQGRLGFIRLATSTQLDDLRLKGELRPLGELMARQALTYDLASPRKLIAHLVTDLSGEQRIGAFELAPD
jgi:hypothetical protein